VKRMPKKKIDKEEKQKKPDSKKSTKKHAGGRPTLYSQELADHIMKRIACSTCGIQELCEKDETLPSHQTIKNWTWEYPEFFARYLAAKEHQAHNLSEECEKMAREKSYIPDAQGNMKVDPGFVASQALMVSTRRWYVSKLAPKYFGDKKAIEEIKNQNEDLKNELMALRTQLADKNKKEY
jgi:hypothetical protein